LREKGKENDREWKILKCEASVFENSITLCSVTCWGIGEQCDREKVIEGVNLIKPQNILSEIPRQNCLKQSLYTKKWRTGG
jgi:hypothetical protein